jgi:hypothetical protein
MAKNGAIKMSRPLLGKAEKVDFPKFGLKGLNAKVDTGAYTSSIDCEYIKEIEEDGKKVLEFVLLHAGKPGYTGDKLYSDDYVLAEIKNANGAQLRYIVMTEVILAGKSYTIRFSLSDRSKMMYSVLVGRKLIATGDYLVDVKLGEGPTDDEEARGL